MQRSTPPRAFTLIELLLVLVILAVIAGIVFQNFSGRARQAKIKATVSQIATIKGALAAFEVDNGRWPTTQEGLAALVSAPADLATTWKHPYMEQVPVDGFGQPFIYRMEGGAAATYALVSLGPDGQEGTDDDIDRYTRG